MRLHLIFIFILTACSFNQHESKSASGNYVKDTNVAIGGSGRAISNDGSEWVYDHQKSFSDFTTAATLIGGSLATASVNKAKEVTKRTADANATRLARDKVAADLAAQQASLSAKEGATKAAIGAGAVPTVNVITPP